MLFARVSWPRKGEKGAFVPIYCYRYIFFTSKLVTRSTSKQVLTIVGSLFKSSSVDGTIV